MDKASDKILERIRQLLAMAADTASPHEAAIAAGRARKLMDQHQVSLGDLKTESAFSFSHVGKEYRFLPKWLDFLAVGVSYLCDVKYSHAHHWKTTNNSYSKQMMFQGFEQDVQVAVAIFEYLEAQVTQQCATYVAKHRGDKRGYVASIGDPFKQGAASELQRRCKSMKKEREEDRTLIEHKTGTSLVLFKMAQVEAEFGKMKLTDKKLVVRHDAGLAAMAAGREAAKHMKLFQEVE